MTTAHYDVVIVGGGHAGAQAAITLRMRGFAGRVAIIGAEPDLPYERPPLSKEYLAGDKPFERMLIRPPAFWTDRDIAMLTGRTVVAVDPAAKVVTTADDTAIGYDALVWAAGGDARSLTCPGGDAAGVHRVRTRADADAIARDLAPGARVVVIGAGYVGLETAAVLRKRDHPVTVIEAQDRVLARVAGRELSAFYADEHRRQGVDLRLGAGVVAIETTDGRVTGVRLDDGTIVPADLVIVGIGIAPAVAPLLDAGAAGGNGVAVDDLCRTSLPDVYAIGDCAQHANAFAGGDPIRLESVQNANDMASTVAKALTGAPEPYHAVPWFWSNQYDLKLQTVGLSIGHDATVLRGDPARRSFSVVYLRDEKVIALDCVNAVGDYVAGRALVVQGARITPTLLADTTLRLKEIAASA